MYFMMCDRQVHTRNESRNKSFHLLSPGCQDSHVIWKITANRTIKTGESIAIKLILTLWKATNVFVYVSMSVSGNSQMRAPFSV